MSMFKNKSELKAKPSTRMSLESFKSTAAAHSVKDQVQAITGGTMVGCHGGMAT